MTAPSETFYLGGFTTTPLEIQLKSKLEQLLKCADPAFRQPNTTNIFPTRPLPVVGRPENHKMALRIL